MSNNLNLDQVSSGQSAKETTINTATGQLDAAITEIYDADFTSGSVTLTDSQYRRNFRFNLTNVATSGRVFTLGASGIKKTSLISLPAAATNSVEIRAYSGTGTVLTIQPGQTMLVRTNGSANGIEGWILENANSAVEPQAIGFQMIGEQASANQKIGLFVMPWAGSIKAAMTGSVCKAGVAAAAQTDFTLRKNGSTFVTIRFAAAGTTATYVSGSDTTFAAGDIIELRGPGTADADLADVGFTIYLTRTGR